MGRTALSNATAKADLGFLQAPVFRAFCNALAVWLTYGARRTMDKVMVVVAPTAALVAAGFEHSGANMYLVPIGCS